MLDERETAMILGKIGKRAKKKFDTIDRPVINWIMDVELWHKNQPLDLKRLLESDDYTFMHDLSGIAKHIDRATGTIDELFLPRTALPEPQPKEDF